MAVNYNKLFDVAYSTEIPESIKEAVFEKLDIPVLESCECSSEVLYYMDFLDKMAYSNMSESLIDEIIDRVIGNLDEAFVEEIYEEYVKHKSLEYVSEADLPIGLAAMRRMEKQKHEDNYRNLEKKIQRKKDIKQAKQNVKDTVNKTKEGIKGAFNTAKNAAVEAGNKAKEVATKKGEEIKAATQPARDIASYTAHKAKEGGKSVLDKVKGAVGKVKNWWNDYKAKAKAYGDTKRQEAQDREDAEFLKQRDGEDRGAYKKRIKSSGKYGWAYPTEIGAKQGQYMRLDKLNALRNKAQSSAVVDKATSKKELANA